jgi:hypothetical protein
MDRNILWENI